MARPPHPNGAAATHHKIITLGESNVGKSSFMNSLRHSCGDRHDAFEHITPSISVEYAAFVAEWERTSRVPAGGAPGGGSGVAPGASTAVPATRGSYANQGGVEAHLPQGRQLTSCPAQRIHVWDTSGQEQFRALTTQYYRNANAVIFMYDITSPESAISFARWKEEMHRLGGLPHDVPVVLVGNKTDTLDNDRCGAVPRHRSSSASTSPMFERPADKPPLFGRVVATTAAPAGGAKPPTTRAPQQQDDHVMLDMNGRAVPTITPATHPALFALPAVTYAVKAATEMNLAHFVISAHHNHSASQAVLCYLLDATQKHRGFRIRSIRLPRQQQPAEGVSWDESGPAAAAGGAAGVSWTSYVVSSSLTALSATARFVVASTVGASGGGRQDAMSGGRGQRGRGGSSASSQKSAFSMCVVS